MKSSNLLILIGYALMSFPMAQAMGWWALPLMTGLGLVFAGNRDAAREEAVRRSDANMKSYMKIRGL